MTLREWVLKYPLSTRDMTTDEWKREFDRFTRECLKFKSSDSYILEKTI